jgi:predicted nuclease of predicted toxin-antitoxin system
MAGPPSKSKKRSGANSPSNSLPEPPVFFLDRSLGKVVISTALRAAGATVHVHEDYFPPDAKDEVWLAEVGRRGWIVLTKDRKIRYRAIERIALLNAGVGAFILTAGNFNGEDMAKVFVKALPRIQKFLEKHERPFIANITGSGSVSMLFQSK